MHVWCKLFTEPELGFSCTLSCKLSPKPLPGALIPLNCDTLTLSHTITEIKIYFRCAEALERSTLTSLACACQQNTFQKLYAVNQLLQDKSLFTNDMQMTSRGKSLGKPAGRPLMHDLTSFQLTRAFSSRTIEKKYRNWGELRAQ